MDNITPWIMAIRPKTLIASLAPVLLGTVLAFSVYGNISASLALCMLFACIFIQIGTNLINDALDFKKGADTQARLGPKRVTQSGLIPFRVVLGAGFFSLFLAFLIGIPLIYHGGIILSLILLVSLLLAYLYTGGPFPLAYLGLGDLFVFLFFGLAATLVAYYVQTGYWDSVALLAGTQVGLLATSLIAVNNLRDYREDQRANKRTLAVQFGPFFSRVEISFLLLCPFVLGVFWIKNGFYLAAWLPFILLPFAMKIVKSVWKTPPSEQYNQFLASCAQLQLFFILALCIGYILR